MKVNYNVSALIANNALNKNDNQLSSVSERLSTGYKINHAKDNPSGLAIAKRMNMQLRGLSNASQNASDGVSIVQTAEGSIQEMQAMIQRLSELAIQATTGTNTDNERELVQQEVDQLKQELTRMAEDTEFNGKKLLNGSCDLKGYTDAKGVKVSSYSDEVQAGKYKLTSVTPTYDAEGNLQEGSISILKDGSEGSFPADAQISYKQNTATIKASGGFEMTITLDDTVTPTSADGSVTMEMTGMGALRMQIGANEGEVMEIRISAITLEAMGISDVDVSTEESAKAAIDQFSSANSYISSVRSKLGAYQNRLEHTADSLDVTKENVTQAYSRIMDSDMAEEMTDYANLQVLTQASTSMLTQANERPQQVLQLLQ